jgi:rSAM/selenodomain-associated transferase 2
VPLLLYYSGLISKDSVINLIEMNHVHNKSRSTGSDSYRPVRNISAVVPTLNEGSCIRECITSLLDQPQITEIIVSDGGSVDNTGALSTDSGARFIQSRHLGRGFQIFDGILHTSGDVILIIHADCQLTNGAAKRIINALNKAPLLAGGSFGMAFASRKHRLGLIAFLNNLRALLTGISFGDQGQFFRRDTLERIGGFPRQMLMEDVELSLRLKKAGKLAFLPRGILVSPRRWETGSFAPRTIQVLHLFSRYLLMRRKGCIEKMANEYYRRYYD